MSSVAAVLLAAAAGGLMVPDGERRLRRIAPVAGQAGRTGLPGVRVLLAAGVVVGAVAAAGPLGLAAVVAAVTAVRLATARAGRRRVERVRTAVLDLLVALAAELRAGHQPRAALVAACAAGPPLLVPVAAAARSPVTDPSVALDLAARQPGAEALGDLAVTWRVAADTGTGLVAVVERVAGAARADAAVRREVASQLAGPRATAALLAGLPLAGIGLGTALGADPLGFLVGSRPGRVCLLVAVLLVAAGTTWTDVIARRAEGVS